MAATVAGTIIFDSSVIGIAILLVLIFAGGEGVYDKCCPDDD